MKTKLKHIADIHTGLFAKPTIDGDLVYLQAKHFDENGQLNTTLYPDLKADNSNKRHILTSENVLFSAKGTKNFATVFKSNQLPAVASTSFFVIKLKVKNILPDYLAWFLNYPTTQKFLKSQAIGSSIVSISKAVLEEVEIPITNLSTQQAILKITELRNQEKALKQQIETLTEELIQQKILKTIKKS